MCHVALPCHPPFRLGGTSLQTPDGSARFVWNVVPLSKRDRYTFDLHRSILVLFGLRHSTAGSIAVVVR